MKLTGFERRHRQFCTELGSMDVAISLMTACFLLFAWNGHALRGLGTMRFQRCSFWGKINMRLTEKYQFITVMVTSHYRSH